MRPAAGFGDPRTRSLIDQAPARWWPLGELWAAVEAAYTSPGRHYHTLTHLRALGGWFTEVGRGGPGWRDPESVFAALLAHDAVYDVRSTDNEARSALLCRQWCADWLGIDSAAAERCVLATAGHAGPPAADDPDLLLFLDCDLSILGADPTSYEAYARGVEAEYLPVAPEPIYRAGRAAFLQNMLAKPNVFRTEFFRERLEDRARLNLATELRALLTGTEAPRGDG
jgi:predicted metal-dependent HD superfamily phosphohydrolase